MRAPAGPGVVAHCVSGVPVGALALTFSGLRCWAQGCILLRGEDPNGGLDALKLS